MLLWKYQFQPSWCPDVATAQVAVEGVISQYSEAIKHFFVEVVYIAMAALKFPPSTTTLHLPLDIVPLQQAWFL